MHQHHQVLLLLNPRTLVRCRKLEARQNGKLPQLLQALLHQQVLYLNVATESLRSLIALTQSAHRTPEVEVQALHYLLQDHLSPAWPHNFRIVMKHQLDYVAILLRLLPLLKRILLAYHLSILATHD